MTAKAALAKNWNMRVTRLLFC